MDLLVTGGSGLVGWDLVNRASDQGHDVTAAYHTNPVTHADSRSVELDVRDPERVREVVAAADPDTVVHAAAMTDVDACERHQDRARAVNVAGTKNVVRACESVGARLVFFSTSFVFDGEGQLFEEGDERSAVNHYGATKILAEDALADSDIPTTTCRIDQPFGWSMDWQQPPFVEWVLTQCEEGESFPVFTDWSNTPVYAPDCNEAVLKLLESGSEGVYHVVGSDYLSRYEWARAIADVFGYDPALIEEGHSSQAGLPAARPNNHLCNAKVRETVDTEFRSIEAALTGMADRATQEE
jgi:dTDP-4-dehydrorhamnose reductase